MNTNRIINNVKTYYNATADYNPFNKNSGAYYITRQTLDDIYESHKKKDVQKQKILGIILGNIAVFSALGAYAVFKGIPKSFYKRLGKFGQKLEERLNPEDNSPVAKIYKFLLKKSRIKMEKARSINNFTSFKDLLFKHIMGKTKFTAKIHEVITRIFEKLSRKTVNGKYGTFESSFENLCSKLDELNATIPNKPVTINGITKTSGEWLEEIQKIRERIQERVKAGFGSKARFERYSDMVRVTDGLDSKVITKSRAGDLSKSATVTENLHVIANSDSLNKFIAEDILAAEKSALRRDVISKRFQITRNINDIYNETRNILDNIAKSLETNDKTSQMYIKLLKERLKLYKNISGISEIQLREKINNEIITDLRSLTNTLQKSKIQYDEQVRQNMLTGIKEIENIITSSQKGDMQELLTIYKALLPRNEYLELRSKTDSVVKKLDKAINTETDDFFDKLRDLRLGSAPTDVFSMITPVVTVGMGLGLAKDKDERISAALKYGIPAIGAVATTFIMTTSLISGFTGLAAGILSGIILGEIGDFVDKFRQNIKKHKESENNNTEEKIAENKKPAEDIKEV